MNTQEWSPELIQSRLLEWREQTKKNFFWFCVSVLELDRRGDLALFHKELCEFLAATVVSKQIILLPRNHLKSTLTEAYVLWRLVNNPNLTCFYISVSTDQAKNNLRNIKQPFESNPWFRLLYPETIPKFLQQDENNKYRSKMDSEKWGEYEMIIGGRDPNISERDASVRVRGMDKSITGSHCDLMIWDDPIDEKSVTTHAMREKAKETVRLGRSIIKPGGKTIFIGTRYHPKDLYSWLIDLDMYEVIQKPAYTQDPETKQFKILFPQLFVMTEAEVKRNADGEPINVSFESLRKEQGETIFSHQYLLKAIADQDRPFQERDIRYWCGNYQGGKIVATLYYRDVDGNYIKPPPGEDVFEGLVQTALTVDPAKSEKKAADETGIAVGSFSQDERLFMHEAVGFKAQLAKMILDVILRFKKIYNPGRMGVEKHGSEWTQEVSDLYTAMVNEKRINFEELSTAYGGKINKAGRILLLQPWLESHRFYLPLFENEKGGLEPKPWVPKFLDQLLDFVVTEGGDNVDDIIDATANLLQLNIIDVTPRRKRREEEQQRRFDRAGVVSQIMGY